MKEKPKKRVLHDRYRDDIFNGLYSDEFDRTTSKRIIRKALNEDDDQDDFY